MKFKEYWALAKLSLKNNKKTSRSTILGQVFGFLFLIPIMLLLLGLNKGISDELAKHPGYNYYIMSMADYRIDTEDNYLSNNISGSEHITEFVKEPYSASKVVYESYSIHKDCTLKIKSDKASSSYEYTGKYDSSETIPFNVWDSKMSKSLFPASIDEKNAFLSGGVFEGDGKGQVIVSEYYLDMIGIDSSDVLGKYLTMCYDEYPYYIYDNHEVGEDEEYTVFRDFKIVGVIKNSLTKEYYNEYNTSDQHYMGAMMYFCDSSVYDAQGRGMLKGKLTSDGKTVVENFADRDALLGEGYMMLLNAISGLSDSTMAATFVYGECQSMEDLNKAVVYINDITNSINPRAIYLMHRSSTYSSYWPMYQSGHLVSVAFLSVSVVILVCTLINFYCSVTHDIGKRRHYLTLMRAVGAKNKVIPRLYMAESLVITSKSGIAIAVVGSVIGIVIKYIFDQLAQSSGVFIGITLPWWLIFAVVGCTVAFAIGISALISWACSYRLSKKKITDILNNE